MRRLLFILPVVVFAGLLAWFAKGLTQDPRKLPSALIDRPAPEFDLPPLGTRPGLAKSDLAGEVTLVNFFASWCVPCRVEHPMLMRLAEEGKVRVVGVDYKDKPEDAQALLTQLGDPYKRIGVDRSGRVAIDFGVYGVPETYLIDREGRIRFRQVGPLTPDDYQKHVLPLLKELGQS